MENKNFETINFWAALFLLIYSAKVDAETLAAVSSGDNCILLIVDGHAVNRPHWFCSVPIETFAAIHIKTEQISVTAACQNKVLEHLSTEYCVRTVHHWDGLWVVENVECFYGFVGRSGNDEAREWGCEQIDCSLVNPLAWDRLVRAHIVGYQLSIFQACRENDVIIDAITVEVYLADRTWMRILHLPNALSSVDVPNGHRAASVTRHNEAVSPFKFYDRVFVSIEKALGTLFGVKIPYEQTCVIGCRDTDVLIVYQDLRYSRIMPNEVLASHSFRVPEAQ